MLGGKGAMPSTPPDPIDWDNMTDAEIGAYFRARRERLRSNKRPDDAGGMDEIDIAVTAGLGSLLF